MRRAKDDFSEHTYQGLACFGFNATFRISDYILGRKILLSNSILFGAHEQ